MDTGNAFKSKIWGWSEFFLGKASWNSKIFSVLTALYSYYRSKDSLYSGVTGLWAGVADKLEVWLSMGQRFCSLSHTWISTGAYHRCQGPGLWANQLVTFYYNGLLASLPCLFLCHSCCLTECKINLTLYSTFTLQLQTTKIPWLAKLDINAELNFAVGVKLLYICTIITLFLSLMVAYVLGCIRERNLVSEK